ncbi:mandelate racemase/muconate lactonizing enzyme family protein [Penicillium maclennaniae]|uniref:mandelate racemase/muconate lactonizing enzyme family protein n=1 Tax=Penicillium maclennaniae TaxID=1343394 RepID=UPI0025411484|nr:mandelate racemase/muconate lactonizing enzyme family protein [Penicillium maclennaniae]KAJ5678205.1 mandelate racemase/muconate lactonizing enzyme family protein [Penicillium maclennaniae]
MAPGIYRGGLLFIFAISSNDIALYNLRGRRPSATVYELLCASSPIALTGGDHTGDFEAVGQARLTQGFKASVMNATEDVKWLDSSSIVIEDLKKPLNDSSGAKSKTFDERFVFVPRSQG